MIRLKIKEVAQAKGISQRQLMMRSGLDMRIVRNVLRNEHANITMSTLDRIAIVLQVDARELIESEHEDNKKKTIEGE